MSTKQQLYKICLESIQRKLQTIEERLADIEQSLHAETKSSVGDKYETGRAMLHLEKDKIMSQLAAVLQSKKVLDEMKADKVCSSIETGALVTTEDNTKYYFAISQGKAKLEEENYFILSIVSPIGQAMRGKKLGDTFEFRGKKCTIKEIL